ncbi:MAG: hypothetical protein KGN84_08825 [Acidobacteriota bacterium]|nr:hypothetical protein [Acidobacteriota bacterium]
MRDVKISPVTFVVALAGILAVGGFTWLTFGPKPAPPPPPALTQEAKAYLPNLQLSNVHMQAAESYAQGRLIEILGDVRNTGPRKVKLVEVTCIFRDYSQQEIARERVFVVPPDSEGLATNQTKPFRLPFDTIPDSWNQAMPALVIAQIQFE